MPPKKRVSKSITASVAEAEPATNAELLALIKKQSKMIEELKRNQQTLKSNQAILMADRDREQNGFEVGDDSASETDYTYSSDDKYNYALHISRLRGQTYQPTAFQSYLRLSDHCKFVCIVSFLNVYDVANLDIALALKNKQTKVHRKAFLKNLRGTRILGVENSILPSFACLEWCYLRGIVINHIKQSFVFTIQDDDDLGMDDDRVEVKEKTLIYVAYTKLLKDKISSNFFRYILRAVDLNVRLPQLHHHGYTPLILATKYEFLDTAEFLLERMKVASKGNAHTFARFADAKDEYGDTALMKAAGDLDHTEIVRLLIDAGVSIDETNKQDFSALIMAIECGNVDMALMLINANADIEISTKLSYAADSAIQATMELKKKYGGDRALHLASCNGYERVVKALIDRKVDIDAQTQMGWTSLMFAAHEGHLNIVKLLLEKKANATITTYDIVDLEDKYKMQCKTVIEIVEMKNEYIKEKVGDIESAPWSPLESTLLLKLEKENNERMKILELLRNSLN